MIGALGLGQRDGAGQSGAVVNLKKGQFVSPQEFLHAVEKVVSTGNRRLILTERGSSFGYNNLVVDMRSLPIMRKTGYPVVLDVTHSVQLPGGAGNASGGQPGRAQRLAPQIPMQRPGTAQEMAQAIVWLLSDQSSYCTGSILDATGGR